jgi:haloalkane dehalogenase
MLVPGTPDDPAAPANRNAWTVLERWDKPFVCAFGAHDMITRGADRILIERIPGAKGQAHTTLEDAAHFSQQDAGPQLAELIADLDRRLS